jgi:hypothetical protein
VSPVVAARLVRGSLVVLLLAVAGATSFAAEFVVVEDECRGRQLVIQGAIEPGDYARFRERMFGLVAGEPLPDVQDADLLWTVKLDSSGGDLDEAMRIGRFLRGALATTEVGYRYARRLDGVWDFSRSGELLCLDGSGTLSGCSGALLPAECTGACLLIWLGGAERFAMEGRLGAHGLAGVPDRVESYLEEMGVSAATLHGAMAASADGWLNYAARRSLGGPAEALQALLADCPAPLTADESFASVTADSRTERDRLMDRAEAHRACRQQRLAAVRAGSAAWGDPVATALP